MTTSDVGGPATTGGVDDMPDLSWLGDGESGLRVLAIVWATVDLERALADLGLDPALARDAASDALLGARVVLAPAAVAGERPSAIAEPSTEGRLAFTLARDGEGPAGRYVAVPADLDTIRRRAAQAGVALSGPARGPFGRSVLVTRERRQPHVILVEGATVPSRP